MNVLLRGTLHALGWLIFTLVPLFFHEVMRNKKKAKQRHWTTLFYSLGTLLDGAMRRTSVCQSTYFDVVCNK